MADVFLSYKREDAARVRKLAIALREAGLKVWWDEDIPASAPWEATIESELAEAKAVVVCWSPDAVASENVRSEARVARGDGRLIQVFVRPCAPPLFFGERQGVDLSDWQGKPDDPRVTKIAESARAIAAGKRINLPWQRQTERWRHRRLRVVLTALVLIAGSVAGWWVLSRGKVDRPQTLAVLPFRAANAGDANLVDAIWDDTRGAISRNPNLRVLGRQSVETLAEKHLDPADYRRKVGADYLLDGSVQHVADDVEVKVSLVRTMDGAEVWSDQLGGKLDNVFAFQQRIANEVEGRIRGRVAPGGGTTAKNIATSGDVYALFAEAKANIRKRNGPGWVAGSKLLKRAVAIDPNYAPAWAELAVTTRFLGQGEPIEKVRGEAIGYAHRALTLAPNLAHAHAAVAMVEDFSPETEGELRRAVALDPGDVEAWMWLGSCLTLQNRLRIALKAQTRAVDIEPLWYTAMYNKMDVLARLDDWQGIAAELRRAEATGDPYITLRAREHAAFLRGQIALQARYEFEVRRQFPDQKTNFESADVLTQLGYVDEAAAIYGAPPSVAAPYKGIAVSREVLRQRYRNPTDFWLDSDTPNVYGRLLAKNGRLGEYIGLYKAAFHNADDFYSTIAWGTWEQFANMAPTVTANLRAAGENDLAQQIIDKEESIIAPLLRNGPANRELAWNLAQLRAVEGRDDEAISLLRRAVDQHWLPDRTNFAIDIADEPSFVNLQKRPDFQIIRRQIIAHIQQERRQVTPAMIAEAGLGLKAAA